MKTQSERNTVMRWILALLILATPFFLSACRSTSETEATSGAAPREVVLALEEMDEESKFAAHAFPPTLSDVDYHQNAWEVIDCMDCHADGIADAPLVVHQGLPERLMTAQCRS